VKKRMRIKWVGLLVVGGASLGGCLTHGDKKELQDQLFEVRTKMLTIEGQLHETGQRGSSADQRLASSYVKIETLQGELQRILGEIDRLKIGVQTGKLPGTKEEEASVAATLHGVETRVAELEKAQVEILTALEKVKSHHGAGKKGAAADKDKGKGKSLEVLEEAFTHKKYSSIVEEAPALLKKKQVKHLDRVHYLYAESLFRLSRLEEAALEYDKLLKIPTLTSSYPHIQLRLGDCFRRLGDKATALIYYGELTAKSPNSSEAKSAEEHIDKLKK